MSNFIPTYEYPRSPWMHFVFLIVIGVLSLPCYEAYQAHTPLFIWLGIPILFYYPSECESTLSSSYYPTRDYVNGRIPIYLVKQGNRSVAGFNEYNLDKYFVYRLLTEFNRARLAYTVQGIDRYPKTFKFLFFIKLNICTQVNDYERRYR